MPPSNHGVDPFEIERLIGEVAKRHNALLGRDDPIFMTVTLNELIIARALERIEATVEASQDQIAAGTAQQIAASKTIAANLITSAADHVAGHIAAAAAEAAQQIEAVVAEELRGARLAANTAQKARGATWWAAGIAVAAAIAAALTAALPLLDAGTEPVTDCRVGAARRP
jgi:hypothetical protein